MSPNLRGRTPRRKGIRTLLLLGTALFGTGCASTGPVYDPLQPYNRAMHRVNTALDDYLMRPVTTGYVYITPAPLQKGVANFYDNLGYPLVFANQLLQGKFSLGLRDLARFLVNSTVGLGGLLDPATGFGLPAHDEDFGQTLAVWGIGSGPYIVVPLLGPFTLRGGAGELMNAYSTSIPRYIDDISVRNSIVGFGYIDTRAGLLETESLISGGDEYLFIRDAYLQRREFLISDGQEETDPFLD